MAAVVVPCQHLIPITEAWSPASLPARPDLRVVADGRSPRRTRPAAATYRRRRLVALAAAVVLAACVALAGRAVIPATGGGPFPAPGSSPVSGLSAAGQQAYVIQPGDTIWSVARRIQPAGDIRPLVDELVDRNGGAALRPGQVLVLS